jgi:hypothetical protein
MAAIFTPPLGIRCALDRIARREQILLFRFFPIERAATDDHAKFSGQWAGPQEDTKLDRIPRPDRVRGATAWHPNAGGVPADTGKQRAGSDSD